MMNLSATLALLLLTMSPLHAELLDRARQQCQLIQVQCAQVLCNSSEESRTRLGLFLDAQESAIRGLQSEVVAAVQWRKEAADLARKLDSLRQSAILNQVLLPQEEAAIYSRVDAMEQQIQVLQSKLDASDRPELEAMSNQLAYDFKLLRILSRPPKMPRGEIVRELKLHQAGVNSISVSADGSRAVSVDIEGKALVWDTLAGVPISEFRGHGRSDINSVGLFADYRHALSVDGEGQAFVWDTRTREKITEFRGHGRSRVFGVSLSADNRRAVSVGDHGKAFVWDTQTGAHIATFQSHFKSYISSVSLSREGLRAVSADSVGKAFVWDARTGVQIAEFRGHDDTWISSVNLTADGSCAVSVGRHGKAFSWDGRTGAQIAEFRGHGDAWIDSVSLSVDGSRAVSVDLDGKALVWDTRTGKLIRDYREQSRPISSVTWDEFHGRFYFGLLDGRILVGE